MKLIYLAIALILVSCMITACIPTKDKDKLKPTLVEAETTDFSPKIIFINVNVIRASDGTITANLINKIITDGRLKTENEKSDIKKEGDFECYFLDEERLPVDSYYIKNPLRKSIEYVDSSGVLGRKTVALDKTVLSLRMQLEAETKILSLEMIDKTNIKLLEIEL